jgi:hypothetical protein
MPFVPGGTKAEVPVGPHFALQVIEDDVPMSVAIPPGSQLYLVEDASRVDKVFPFILKKLSHEKIVFHMADADGHVSEYVYKLASGKPLSKGALDRMRRNGAKVRR